MFQLSFEQDAYLHTRFQWLCYITIHVAFQKLYQVVADRTIEQLLSSLFVIQLNRTRTGSRRMFMQYCRAFLQISSLMLRF